MKKYIVIVDYGLGNIRSAEQSLKNVVEENCIDADVRISNRVKDIDLASHIILPGQGAFEACMEGLKNISGMIRALSRNVLVHKKPFLGICVGMQLLATKSHENGIHTGLGWIDGEIRKMPQTGLKLPHMGWNEVSIKTKENNLIKDKEEKNYYFVHSYFFKCKSITNEVASTSYGSDFTSIVSKENIYGVQFHPEKSSIQGLRLIKNFINL